MKRLTKKLKNGYTWKTCYLDCIPKLGKLEDLEEQGKLIKLKFKPSDTVYVLDERIEKQGRKKVSVPYVEKYIVDQIVIGGVGFPFYNICNDKNEWLLTDDDVMYSTREEAEKKLEEMNNEHNYE